MSMLIDSLEAINIFSSVLLWILNLRITHSGNTGDFYWLPHATFDCQLFRSYLIDFCIIFHVLVRNYDRCEGSW